MKSQKKGSLQYQQSDELARVKKAHYDSENGDRKADKNYKAANRKYNMKVHACTYKEFCLHMQEVDDSTRLTSLS